MQVKFVIYSYIMKICSRKCENAGEIHKNCEDLPMLIVFTGNLIYNRYIDVNDMVEVFVVKFKVIAKQKNYKQCMVCGMENKFSVMTRFYLLEHNMCCSLFTFRDEHQSYPGRAHGGVISAVLDETIGRAAKNYDPNVWAVTVDMNVKYMKPTPLNVELKCVGRVVRNRSRAFTGTGEIYLPDGEVCASAEITYVKLPESKIANPEIIAAEELLLADDVTEIDLPEQALKESLPLDKIW